MSPAGVYVQKPALIAKHVVPAAFALLNSTKADERSAAGSLLDCLARLMGPQLLDQAANLSAQAQARVRDIVARVP